MEDGRPDLLRDRPDSVASLATPASWRLITRAVRPPVGVDGVVRAHGEAFPQLTNGLPPGRPGPSAAAEGWVPPDTAGAVVAGEAISPVVALRPRPPALVDRRNDAVGIALVPTEERNRPSRVVVGAEEQREGALADDRDLRDRAGRNVTWVNPFEMLRRERARFVLGPKGAQRLALRRPRSRASLNLLNKSKNVYDVMENRQRFIVTQQGVVAREAVQSFWTMSRVFGMGSRAPDQTKRRVRLAARNKAPFSDGER